jgi:hypothetical protein
VTADRVAQIERAIGDELRDRSQEIGAIGVHSVTLTVNLTDGGLLDTVISRVDRKRVLRDRTTVRRN